MRFIFSGLSLMALISLVSGIRNLAPYKAELVMRIGRQRVLRFNRFILVMPVAILLIISLLIFLVWRSEPVLRYIHMIWVLGLWMLGTLAMFAFVVPVRLSLAHDKVIETCLANIHCCLL